MDEEIMIAEECCYYNKDNYPYCCEIWDNECEAQNCYYKQLKKTKKENKKLKEKLDKIEKVILRCKEANCTNCEYQTKCNFNGDDFDDFLLRIIEGAEDE